MCLRCFAFRRDGGNDDRYVPMTRDKQYLGIETLRFLCAVAVVVWHYQHFYMGSGETYVVPFSREMQPLFGLLQPFYGWGYMSVSIFWMISGFIFFWKYHEAIADGAVGGFKFFVLRFSRLYPLHFVTLLAAAGLQIAFAAGHGGEALVYPHQDLKHFVLNLFFASSWGLEDGLSFNGPIWSVSIEVLVYALFFVVSSWMRTDLWRRIGLVVVMVVLWVANERWGFAGSRLLLSCSIYFYMGGVVHAAVRRVSETYLRIAAPFVLVGGVAVGVLFFRNDVNTSKIFILIFSTALLVGFIGLDGWPLMGRIFERIAPAADMTYSSYLLHFPIQIAMVIVTDRLGYGRLVYNEPWMLAIFLGLVFSSAWWVHHGFERPAQSLIRRLLSARRQRVMPAAA